jgi:hypothetical protein
VVAVVTTVAVVVVAVMAVEEVVPMLLVRFAARLVMMLLLAGTGLIPVLLHKTPISNFEAIINSSQTIFGSSLGSLNHSSQPIFLRCSSSICLTLNLYHLSSSLPLQWLVLTPPSWDLHLKFSLSFGSLILVPHIMSLLIL